MARIREPVLLILFLCAVFVVALQGLAIIEGENRAAAGKALRTVVHTMEEGLLLWSANRIEDARTLAARPELVRQAKTLLDLPRTRDALLNAKATQSTLREILNPELEHQGYLGFFVISPDRVNLASMRNANIGVRNLIDEQRGELLDRVFKGESLIVPTVVSDVPLQGGDARRIASPPTMFAATPIHDADGTVIAAFTIRLDPIRDFSSLMRLGRIGESGETYAFDKNGVMLTESRFEEELRTVGVIGKREKSVLNIRVAEPDVDLTKGEKPKQPQENRPLTLMARHALEGASGQNTKGYRDYRGVTVLGAWTWDKELGLGLATEINADEALQSYYTARNVVMGSLGVTAFLSILITLYLTMLRGRALRGLEQSQAVLESRVVERTESLMQVNDRLQEQVEERIRAEEKLKIAHEQLEESNAKLEELATVDGLTGIANRRAFDQNLQAEWNRCLRQSAPVSLALMDIDCFKLYNDAFGHQAGDACLQKVGEILKGRTYNRRPGDMAARYGGEEFAVILSDVPLDNAAVIAENIRVDVLNAAISHTSTKVAEAGIVTISIGVATMVPSIGQSPDALIRQADQALYDAKEQGRNRVALAATAAP